MRLQAAFIDRDGTMGGDASISYPGDFTLYPYTLQAFDILRQSGMMLFAFTNQPGISRGLASSYDFKSEMIGFGLDDVYICTHTDEDHCICRKPKPGMIIKAASEHNLSIKDCVVIGDRWSDMLAVANAGAHCVLVLTGAGNDAMSIYRNKWCNTEPDYVARNILDAAQWLSGG